MKIIKNKKLSDYIQLLVDINQINMSVSDMLSSTINNAEIINEDTFNLAKKNFPNRKDKEIVAYAIFNYLELDSDIEEHYSFLEDDLLPSINALNEIDYINNPYYKNIRIPKVSVGEYSLDMDKYFPLEIFPYLDMGVKEDYLETNSLGFFKKDFYFAVLKHQDVTWMSVTPNEIETMKKAVEEASGKVLVYGLGLGYYPYMISLKEEVKEITIIEKDSNIIQLFEENILPQFKYKSKIKIVHDDAFKYMKTSPKFDYIFVDLWHDAFDGILTYVAFKKGERSDCKYFYWLESSFYLLLRRCFITLIEEQLQNKGDKFYKNGKTPTDDIINLYYAKTKNLTIISEAQLNDLLTDKSLLDLLIK